MQSWPEGACQWQKRAGSPHSEKGSFQGQLRARLGAPGQGCVESTCETEELLNRTFQSSEETALYRKIAWIPDPQHSLVVWKVGAGQLEPRLSQGNSEGQG